MRVQRSSSSGSARRRRTRRPDRLIGFRASPWFKLEIKDLHDRGLEAFDAVQHVRIRKEHR